MRNNFLKTFGHVRISPVLVLYVGAYRIRPHGGEDAHLTMVFCLPPSFHVRAHQGVCDTPLRFSRDVGTTVFLHLGLRDCFTIQDELANGEHSSAGRQWCFRDRESWFEIRAKYICHLRNEGRFLRKTAIAFAEMKLSLAQNGYRNRDNEIVACANRHRNRENEIVACANPLRNRDNEIVTCANVHRNRDNEIVTCANVHRNRDNEIVACANAHRNRDNEIVACANAHRNRDNEIVTPTLRLRQTR